MTEAEKAFNKMYGWGAKAFENALQRNHDKSQEGKDKSHHMQRAIYEHGDRCIFCGELL